MPLKSTRKPKVKASGHATIAVRDGEKGMEAAPTGKVEDLSIANARLKALTDIGLELASERDPDHLFQRVCTAARDLFGATYVTLGILDRHDHTVQRFFTCGADAICGVGAAHWIKTGDALSGILWTVIAERRTVRGDNPGGDPAKLQLPVLHPEVQAFLAAPIASPAHVYGWICLVGNEGRTFTEDDEDLVLALAGQVGRIYELEHEILERKQAEDAREHREAELQESQRIAGIGSWEWTIATGVVAWSEGMNHVLGRGFDLPAPTFETLASFYTPESWERLGAAIARTIETGAPYELELEMIRADGAICWTTTRGEAIRGADGTVVKLRGTVHDITARKRATEAETRLAAILEATPDLVSIADPEGRLIYLNRAGRKMLGIDGLADLTGYNVQEFHDAANPQVVLTEGIPTAMREGAWSGETELVALDGHAIAVSQVILAHKAPNGTVAFLSTIARDITERRRGEAARRENDQRLQVALSGIKMAVFHQDRALRYTWMHQPQLAYSPDRVVGRTDAELLPPEAARQVTEIKQRVLETGARVQEEVSVVADGATRVFDLVAEPLLDASGEIIGLTGATLDITERKQAEEALRHSEMLNRSLVEHLPQGIFIKDRNSNYLFCNASYARDLGIGPEEIVGEGRFRVLSHGNCRRVQSRRPDGHSRWEDESLRRAVRGGWGESIGPYEQDPLSRPAGENHWHPGVARGHHRAQADGGAARDASCPRGGQPGSCWFRRRKNVAHPIHQQARPEDVRHWGRRGHRGAHDRRCASGPDEDAYVRGGLARGCTRRPVGGRGRASQPGRSRDPNLDRCDGPQRRQRRS
jgi:PAS domain S-box-containing protein